MATTNAYADLVATANSLVGVDEWEDDWSDDYVASIVAPNEAALNRADALLERPCRLSLEFTSEFWKAHLDNIVSLRRLLLGLQYRGQQRSSDGDIHAAVSSDIAMLRLSLVYRNGGTMVDLLSGVACEGVGVDLLRRLRHDLDSDACLALIKTINELLKRRESFDSIVARDEEWDRRVPAEEPSDPEETWDDAMASTERDDDIDDEDREALRIGRELIETMSAALPEVQRHFKRQIDLRSLAVVRLLVGELALRAHHLTTGSHPDNLSALVPAYLDNVPIDPFSGEPLCYRRTDEGFLLYSVGDLGKDCGGMFGSRIDVQCCGADLCLDHEDLSEDHFEQLCQRHGRRSSDVSKPS